MAISLSPPCRRHCSVHCALQNPSFESLLSQLQILNSLNQIIEPIIYVELEVMFYQVIIIINTTNSGQTLLLQWGFFIFRYKTFFIIKTVLPLLDTQILIMKTIIYLQLLNKWFYMNDTTFPYVITSLSPKKFDFPPKTVKQ